MKLHLPKVLLSAVLTACCAFSAQAVELPDTYTQITIADSNQLSDYTTNTETDSYAFLLGQDIVVSSDITMDGGNLLFTSSDGLPSVSLEFTGGDAPALSNQSSLVFDTLSGLSFTNYKDSAIYTSGNLVIQNVNDGVEDSENPDVLFTGNTATATTTSSSYHYSDSYSNGGAIYARSGDVSITGNGDVTFTRNFTSTSGVSNGGAIYARSGDVSITGNGDVLFTGNTATATTTSSSYHYSDSYSYGGAIYAESGEVSISGNGDVTFTGNTATATTTTSSSYDDYFASSSGGAIFAFDNGVSISGNGDVSFLGNSISSCDSRGGAIYAFSGVSISGNGDVIFTGNSASSPESSRGGAIYADSGVSITGNGDVTFTRNFTSTSGVSNGGAIYAFSVSVTGNETVCFEENYESANSTYRLRSIYVGGEDVYDEYVVGDLNLSAKTGGHITFYDSVYNGGTTALNADYTDADGKTQQAKGDIIFSGLYTKTHLDAILEANGEDRVATDKEILNSRTSTLGDTTLYGGTLQVLDGAILDTASLSVEAGSRASVLLRDAELKGTAGITFNAGTTLQVQGDSLITGDVLLLAGSSLDIDGAITINGGLTLGQGLTLSGDILADIRNLQAGQSLTLVSGLESLAVQTQELMRSVEYTTVLSGQELSAADYFSNLQGVGTLVLEYNEASGTMSITATVPEPATATLSLLALAGLCARRRRK